MRLLPRHPGYEMTMWADASAAQATVRSVVASIVGESLDVCGSIGTDLEANCPPVRSGGSFVLFAVRWESGEGGAPLGVTVSRRSVLVGRVSGRAIDYQGGILGTSKHGDGGTAAGAIFQVDVESRSPGDAIGEKPSRKMSPKRPPGGGRVISGGVGRCSHSPLFCSRRRGLSPAIKYCICPRVRAAAEQQGTMEPSLRMPTAPTQSRRLFGSTMLCGRPGHSELGKPVAEARAVHVDALRSRRSPVVQRRPWPMGARTWTLGCGRVAVPGRVCRSVTSPVRSRTHPHLVQWRLD